MTRFMSVIRYAISLIIGISIFEWTLLHHGTIISQAIPSIIPDTGLFDLPIHLLKRPNGFVFLLAPVLLGLASTLLALSMRRESIHAMFQPANLGRLRIAGSCLGLAFMAALLAPFLYGLLSHTDAATIVLCDDPALFLLSLLGGWLATLSSDSGVLFKHANTLRNSLDEIV